MQTAIRALQEVNPLAIHRQAAIKRSNEICTTLADKTRTHQRASNPKQPNVVDDSSLPTNIKLGVGDLKQPNVVGDSDSPLSSLSSLEDMPDPEESEWQLKDDLLCFKSKLYVPTGVLRREAVRLNHDDPHAGHFGYLRTLELIRWKYYWPGISRDIKEYVDTCDTCHRIKLVRHKPYGTLNSLPSARGLFTDLTMHFITNMPPCEYQGMVYDSIFLVMCRYTKMARYIAARMDWAAERLAQAFLEHVWRDKGLPDSIVSDRGSLFTSKFWSASCFYLKIKQRLSTAFHPQTNGQTERQNQTLEQYL